MRFGHRRALVCSRPSISLGAFLLPQYGGGSRWGKRAKIVSHRSAASPSLTSPMLGEGLFGARSSNALLGLIAAPPPLAQRGRRPAGSRRPADHGAVR